jgi:hypothetical protein
MSWSKVGDWVKDNAGTGATLVGSLLTGNVPSAVAAGISLVSSATGSDNPDIALKQLQNNPETLLKLKELVYKEEDSIRNHIKDMKQIELEDAQKEHEQTQTTIRNGDNSDDKVVRYVRPSHATISLISAIAYVFTQTTVDFAVLGALLTLPLTYAGLRGIDKTMATLKQSKQLFEVKK